jgi:hypothetical protein
MLHLRHVMLLALKSSRASNTVDVIWKANNVSFTSETTELRSQIGRHQPWRGPLLAELECMSTLFYLVNLPGSANDDFHQKRCRL